MCIPLSRAQQAQASVRVGKGKVQTAHKGMTQFGTQMSLEDRLKLLRSGAADIVDGQQGRGFFEREKK
ncbi:MAG: hypothetical protein ACYS7Y_35820 [Planctomycetota bacterium]|jgi:hypothetical protein